MNMVSLLTLGLVMKYTFFPVEGRDSVKIVGFFAAMLCVAALVWSVYKSKQETPGLVSEEELQASIKAEVK
jgi:hypothetical protein